MDCSSKLKNMKYKNYILKTMFVYINTGEKIYQLFNLNIKYGKSVDLDYSYTRYITIQVFNFSFTFFLIKYENTNLNKFDAYLINYNKYIRKV